MEAPVVQTHELVKVFKDFWQRPKAKAVSGVSITINQGEVYGLLGPNGSGKSTTIKILLGLLFPTSGVASVFGRSPSDVAVKRRIGFLPEESHLYPYLDAEEILDFYGRLFGLAPEVRRKRVDALIDMTGLGRARNRLVSEYSKGMARRIGIAQALINDPDFVILDEPTTGLDPIGTREIKDLILELKGKGKTVLLCSHLLADVEDVCDRVAIMYGGRVQVEGPTADIVSRSGAVQITASLDDAGARDAVAYIRTLVPAGTTVEMAPPRERLERVFLRVVEDARARDVQTSGVEAARARLDFLTDARESADGTAVLDRLVQADAPAPVAAKLAPVAESLSEKPAAGADASILAALTAGEKAPAAAPEASGAAGQAPGKAGGPDSDLLRKLSEQG